MSALVKWLTITTLYIGYTKKLDYEPHGLVN